MTFEEFAAARLGAMLRFAAAAALAAALLPGAGGLPRFTAQVGASTDVGAGGLFNPVGLVRGVADGAWRVVAGPAWKASRPSS
jgi:hypothetical protein